MTVAVLLTPPAMGAIAVIRIAGPQARAIVHALATSPRVSTLAPGQVARADLLYKDDPLDDALVVCAAPDAWELHLHGGRAVVEAVLAALASLGAETLTPAAARDRGFFGTGIAADIQLALPQAATLTGARLLAAQADGGLAAWARHRLTALTPPALWQLHSAAQWLLTRSEHLTHLLTPPRVALIGPPNAGKSTLANALLGRPIAITSDLPGTTRDWIDAQTTFTHGDIHLPITLLDTAGIRDSHDALERESIARTRAQATRAHLVILVLDATDPASLAAALAPDSPFAPGFCDLIALNKCDLLPAAPALLTPVPAIPLSAKTHAALPALMAAAIQQLGLSHISSTEPFAFAPRHTALLQQLALEPNADAARTLLHTLLTA